MSLLKMADKEFKGNKYYEGSKDLYNQYKVAEGYKKMGDSYGPLAVIAQSLFNNTMQDKEFNKFGKRFKGSNLKMDLLNNNYLKWTPSNTDSLKNMSFTVGPDKPGNWLEGEKPQGIRIGGSVDF